MMIIKNRSDLFSTILILQFASPLLPQAAPVTAAWIASAAAPAPARAGAAGTASAAARHDPEAAAITAWLA